MQPVITATLLLAATLALETPPTSAATPAIASDAVPVVRTIKIPGKQIPTEIAQHAGAVWFVTWNNWPKLQPFLGRISVQGTIRLNEIMEDSKPGLATRTADGTLWFTDSRRGGFWRVIGNGPIVRIKNDRPTVGIAAGPDGALWTTHPDSSTITAYNADGSIRSRWEVPRQKGLAPRPEWIVAGPDGALWFTDTVTNRIGRITTAGVIKLFPLPKGWKSPGEIVATADALWFTVGNQPLLGKMTPQGIIKPVKILAPARAIAAGAEERIWYTNGVRTIGWINADGTSDYVLVHEENGGVRALAAGPDGAMWFVDEKARTVGRVELPKAP